MAKKPLTFKVTGIAKANAYLIKKDATIITATKLGVRQATLYTEGEVKASIAGQRGLLKAVDTGRLMRSPSSDIRGFTGVVSTKVEYAPEIELGTSKMPARPHFKNTLNKNKAKIKAYIQASVAAATKS